MSGIVDLRFLGIHKIFQPPILLGIYAPESIAKVKIILFDGCTIVLQVPQFINLAALSIRSLSDYGRANLLRKPG